MVSEKDEHVQTVFEKYPKVFQELVEASRQDSACTKGDTVSGRHAKDVEYAITEIEKVVQKYREYKLTVMDSQTSGFKDVFGTVVRLFLGEIFSETMGQMTADVIGCTSEMFNEGKGVKSTRDKLVEGTSSHSVSKGKNNRKVTNDRMFKNFFEVSLQSCVPDRVTDSPNQF